MVDSRRRAPGPASSTSAPTAIPTSSAPTRCTTGRERAANVRIEAMAWRREYFWPVVLVVVGVFFLLNNVSALTWLKFDVVWPVLLILLGVWLMVRTRRR